MRSGPHNKGLEQTGSALRNGLGGPCSSIQCSTDARGARHLVALALAALLLCAGSPLSTAEDAKPYNIFQKVTGTWGWKKGSNTCRANPFVISFSEDRKSMVLKYAHPSESWNGESHQEVRYVVSGHTREFIRVALVEPPETRRGTDGALVVWDLVLVAKNKYRWHRTDWQAGVYTEEIERCDRK